MVSRWSGDMFGAEIFLVSRTVVFSWSAWSGVVLGGILY